MPVDHALIPRHRAPQPVPTVQGESNDLV